MAVSSPPSLIISMIINLMGVSTSTKSVNNERILDMINYIFLPKVNVSLEVDVFSEDSS